MVINPETTTDRGNKNSSTPAYLDHSPGRTRSEFPLSSQSQPELKPLREYSNQCHCILNDIRTGLVQLEIDPGNPAILSKIASRLGLVCRDADSWGFHSLCDLALGLQVFLFRSGGRLESARQWTAVNRSLNLLSALVDQCEADFDRRLAVADLLKCLNEPD